MDSNSDYAENYLVMLRGMPVNDRVKIAKDIPNLLLFEDELLDDHGCPQLATAELLTELEFYRKSESVGAAEPLISALRASLVAPAETSTVDSLVRCPESLKPRFTTSVGDLDRLTLGGGYGLTTVAGDAKAGKTMFAMGTAVESALNGWRVIYINAELDRQEAIQNVLRYCNGEIPPELHDSMTLVSPDYCFQPGHAVARIGECVGLDDERILVVLDSINALVDLSSDGAGGDYWGACSIWRNFGVRTTRATLGNVAFLVVSETNMKGGVKGGSLEFKSDLVIRIHKSKDEEDEVEIAVTHSRTTRSGLIGVFKRDWLNARFVRCE